MPPCFISFRFTAFAALAHRTFFASSGVRTISSAMIGIGEDSVRTRIPSRSVLATGCSKTEMSRSFAARAKLSAWLQVYPWFPSIRNSIRGPTAPRIARSRSISDFGSRPIFTLSAESGLGPPLGSLDGASSVHDSNRHVGDHPIPARAEIPGQRHARLLRGEVVDRDVDRGLDRGAAAEDLVHFVGDLAAPLEREPLEGSRHRLDRLHRRPDRLTGHIRWSAAPGAGERTGMNDDQDVLGHGR